jgi:hypothetical protein
MVPKRVARRARACDGFAVAVERVAHAAQGAERRKRFLRVAARDGEREQQRADAHRRDETCRHARCGTTTEHGHILAAARAAVWLMEIKRLWLMGR